jgi:nucleotide-binding universal stress UspA family protein
MQAPMSVLVPIDPTVPSRSAVQLAALVARNLGRDVLLLHVSAQPASLDNLARLHELGRSIRDSGVPVRLRSVQGDVVERILEVAEARNCSWILMGTRLADGSEAGPSVARQVLARARQPVAAVAGGSAYLLESRLPIGVVGQTSPAISRLAEELARVRGSSWATVEAPDAAGRLGAMGGDPALQLGAVLTRPDQLWGPGPGLNPRWRAFLARPAACSLLVVSEGAASRAVR